MPRNKYPEQTLARIIESATRLFMVQGYENTTIQDIIDDLGDLTKGAIYHHFKGKEEILMAVFDRVFTGQLERLIAIRDSKDMTGLEKLRTLLTASITDPGQEKIFTAAPDLRKNPRMLAEMLNESVEETAPHFIQPILEDGIRDGSIRTEYPEELAEVIMVLANIWASPMVILTSRDKLARKMHFLNYMLGELGVPDLLDDSLIKTLEGYQTLYEEKQT